MFHHQETPAYLLQELPDIISEFKYMYPSKSIHKAIVCLTNYTSHEIMRNNLKNVKKCFYVAEMLYCYGDIEVTKAVEKIFLYSCPVFMAMRNNEESFELQVLMPPGLRHAFERVKMNKYSN